jgi:hypothetical protein
MNMDNVFILVIGFASVLTILVLAEVAAKKFGWE